MVQYFNNQFLFIYNFIIKIDPPFKKFVMTMLPSTTIWDYFIHMAHKETTIFITEKQKENIIQDPCQYMLQFQICSIWKTKNTRRKLGGRMSGKGWGMGVWDDGGMVRDNV